MSPQSNLTKRDIQRALQDAVTPPPPKKTREQRRAETARMQKCICGNVAGVGQQYCSSCRAEHDRQRILESARAAADFAEPEASATLNERLRAIEARLDLLEGRVP